MPIENDDDLAPLPDVPGWITPELLADTLETWQPYYAEQLTVADSLAILLSVSRLFDALRNCEPLEKAS